MSRPAFRIDIHVAGELSVIEQVCRRYCQQTGWGFAVQSQRFVYCGGQEDGARIGIVDYPRVPRSNEELWQKARDLARLLLVECCQHSVMIEGPDVTEWISIRDEVASAR